MQDTPDYTATSRTCGSAVRRTDLASVVPAVSRRAKRPSCRGDPRRIDVPQDLTLRVPTQLLDVYFGTPGAVRARDDRVDDGHVLVHCHRPLGRIRRSNARAAICANAGHLDGVIRIERPGRRAPTTSLNRCLAMQAAGLPAGRSRIRNNLIGLVIGAVPTTSKGRRPGARSTTRTSDALPGAQRAAARTTRVAGAPYIRGAEVSIRSIR